MNTYEQLLWTSKKMEDKLIELMGAKEYLTWSKDIAVELFKMNIDEMENGEFKHFCEYYMEVITNDEKVVADMAKDFNTGKHSESNSDGHAPRLFTSLADLRNDD